MADAMPITSNVHCKIKCGCWTIYIKAKIKFPGNIPLKQTTREVTNQILNHCVAWKYL